MKVKRDGGPVKPLGRKRNKGAKKSVNPDLSSRDGNFCVAVVDYWDISQVEIWDEKISSSNRKKDAGVGKRHGPLKVSSFRTIAWVEAPAEIILLFYNKIEQIVFSTLSCENHFL
jgi:hypothetical protein